MGRKLSMASLSSGFFHTSVNTHCRTVLRITPFAASSCRHSPAVARTSLTYSYIARRLSHPVAELHPRCNSLSPLLPLQSGSALHNTPHLTPRGTVTRRGSPLGPSYYAIHSLPEKRFQALLKASHISLGSFNISLRWFVKVWVVASLLRWASYNWVHPSPPIRSQPTTRQCSTCVCFRGGIINRLKFNSSFPGVPPFVISDTD